jgi:IMP dehydrogenase
MKLALSFDDVLLVPKKTFGGSRNKVDISTIVCGIHMELPIFSANMSSVTEVDMSVAMEHKGGLGILHRMCSINDQQIMLEKIYQNYILNLKFETEYVPVFVSVEGSKKGIERIKSIQKMKHMNPFGYCVDVAHADSPDVEDTLVEILKEFPNINLIIGNYATVQGIEDLLTRLNKWNSESDNFFERTAFKVGVGSGSACTTRIVTGCGLPTLQSIFDIRNRFSSDVKIIADGGFKNSGDIVKALAAGADAVMLGSLLAGTKEAPGNVIKHKGGLYKVYRGSASFGQKFEVGKEGYVEGEETLVPYKSSVNTILTQLTEGIKSGMSYCGSLNLEQLRTNSEFVQITNNGFKESTAHGV